MSVATTSAIGFSPSSICVVSIMRGSAYETGPYPGAALLANKRNYCARCGYTCLLHNREFSGHGRTPGWDKLRALDSALFGVGGAAEFDATIEGAHSSPKCSLALWLDADVVVMWPVALAPIARTPIVAVRCGFPLDPWPHLSLFMPQPWSSIC